jgi:hypothetical protein
LLSGRSVRSLDGDTGKGNLEVARLHALDVRDGVAEMLLDLLAFFGLLEVGELFVDLGDELEEWE